MEDCICDIRGWMSQHQLMLNDNKTEVLIVGSRQQLAKVNIDHIQVGASEIKPASSVRNLGAWFDNSMKMDAHIGKVCSKAFFGLYKIKQIRMYLTEDLTRTLVHALVTSHVDYCNSLLFGISQLKMARLQKVLNAAARLTCSVPRYTHITPVLKDLHWLPIVYRIRFKIALLVFKALKGMAPVYLQELLHVKTPGRYSLRSDDQTLLVVPVTKCKTFGDRAFAVAGPRVWNSLPWDIRNTDTLGRFKKNLKTYFFREAFNFD